MYPPSLQKLIDLFAKFPTVGPKTATRFVFYLLGKPKEEIEELVQAILNLKKIIKTCANCFKSFESSEKEKFCEICADKTRDKTLLCVVATEPDLQAIEKTKKYNGLYFILGGTVSTLKIGDLIKLRIKELEERIKQNLNLKEIILALDQTTEGEATFLYLKRNLTPFNKKITHLGRGLPLGGELEYADDETLSAALEGRS
jgi:recombination protein RecR